VQVADINSPETLSLVQETGVGKVVVAAFGQILGPAFLGHFLCMNIHASLLPAYRGAAPIERAIAAGEAQLGVTIMRMVEGLDEGPWALQSRMSLGPWDDAGSAARKLAVLGAEGVDQVLTGLDDGTVTWTQQGPGATYAAKLSVSDMFLDPDKPATRVHDQVRSLSPHLGANVSSGGLKWKVWRAWPYGVGGFEATPCFAQTAEGRPGVLVWEKGRLFLGCAEGVLELLLVQPAGRGKMAVADFLRGYADRLGTKLDEHTREQAD
jgi:methionyl-tRNA formyltransferase